MTPPAKTRAEWADRQIGQPMRHARDVEPSTALRWQHGQRGRGCYFTLENGRRVYRRYPSRLHR